MSFLFRESSLQPNNKEASKDKNSFTEEQLHLLEERRAADWLHTAVKESVTDKSIEHDRDLVARMEILGLTENDYDDFIRNYHKFDKTNGKLLH